MLKIDRVFEMGHIMTFEMPKLRRFVLSQFTGKVLNVFGGNTDLKPYYHGSIISNDINSNAPTDFHYDAMQIDKYFEAQSFDGAIIDPPYSMYQATESYGCSKRVVQRITLVRNAVDILLKPGAIVVTLGYNSTGMTKNRGYVKKKLLLVNLGGSHNDIMVLVEKKVRQELSSFGGKPT
jgi:hypothetical protein